MKGSSYMRLQEAGVGGVSAVAAAGGCTMCAPRLVCQSNGDDWCCIHALSVLLWQKFAGTREKKVLSGPLLDLVFAYVFCMQDVW